MVAFAAFTGKGQVNGFWQFNKTLFLRFLTSVLYGVVLFSGIAAAIGATNFLFNFNFEWDSYAILWVWIVGIFTTVFFLAGVPVDTAALDEDLSYPKALKIFTQYVLIPLSTIYVIILLAYEVKILIQWSLPKGLVSNLILSYAVFGILSLLLVYPVRDRDGNKWLKTYARSFYFLMVPLLGLLFVAVGARVFKYGITEWRYFLLALACWLLFISVYFLAFKKQNIKVIPLSLCILTLLSIYGPQSAFSVSMYSQRRIIIKFFEKQNAFKGGKLMPVDSKKISRKDGSRIVNELHYFIYNYDLEPLQPYLKRNLTLISDSLGKLKSRNMYNDRLADRRELRSIKYEWAKQQLGLSTFELWYNENEEPGIINNFGFQANSDIRDIKGYDFSFSPAMRSDTVTDKLDGVTITQIGTGINTYLLKINGEGIKFNTTDITDKLIKDQKKIAQYKKAPAEYDYEIAYNLPADMLCDTLQSKSYQVKIQIENISVAGLKDNKAKSTVPISNNDTKIVYYIKRR